MKISIVALFASALLVVRPVDARDSGTCQIVVPTDFAAVPSRWLGACSGGRAEGLGVLRAGAMEPYRFFAGQARAGRPVKGLIVIKDGFYTADSFDAHGTRRDITSGDPTEFHALYVLAARAALATAQRFAAAGNRGSAAYYRRLAKQIHDGEPE